VFRGHVPAHLRALTLALAFVGIEKEETVFEPAAERASEGIAKFYRGFIGQSRPQFGDLLNSRCQVFCWPMLFVE